jgi:hypothetical protein
MVIPPSGTDAELEIVGEYDAGKALGKFWVGEEGCDEIECERARLLGWL